MQTANTKRSIVVAGRKTSVSLEDAFWSGLKEIGQGRAQSVSELVSGIDERRQNGNLSSAIRLFVLDHYQGQRRSGAAKHLVADGGLEDRSPLGGGAM